MSSHDGCIRNSAELPASIVTLTGPKLQKWQAAYDQIVR
jgi:hypothetical protein